MNILQNSGIAKVLGGVGATYAGYALSKIAPRIVKDGTFLKNIQKNTVPLVNGLVGLSTCAVGAFTGNPMLAMSGVLQMASDFISHDFFAAKAQAEYEAKKSKLAKDLGISTHDIDDCGHDHSKDSQKEPHTSHGGHNHAHTHSHAEEHKACDGNHDHIHGHVHTYRLQSGTLVRHDSTLKKIFKLNDGIDLKNLPDGFYITKKDNDGHEIKQCNEEYGHYLSEDDTIEVTQMYTGTKNTIPIKQGDEIKKDTFIQDKQCILELETKSDIFAEPDVLKALKNEKAEWSLSSKLGATALTGLVAAIAVGTPFHYFMKGKPLLDSLTKSVGLGKFLANTFLPCEVNAAQMSGYTANMLSHQDINLTKKEALARLSDMKIGEPDSKYHMLIDFNGTLTNGSEFVGTTSADQNTEIAKEDMDNIIHIGEQVNSSHHIHAALKAEYKVEIDKSKIFDMTAPEDNSGWYCQTQDKKYAIGKSSLVEKAIKELHPENEQGSLLEEFKKTKDGFKASDPLSKQTYIMVDGKFHILETKPKIRDDAEGFLKAHEGKFTVITGDVLHDEVKNKLGLNEGNAIENCSPDQKAEKAKEIATARGLKPDQIIAFGDGSNDWHMLQDANVSVQMIDTSEDKTVPNYAGVFSDVVLKDLSDFSILNEVAKKAQQQAKS